MATLSQHRVVVLGLYNSGSSVVAHMFHALGVNMAPPYFVTSDEDADNNYYEPRDLSTKLRRWWNEPLAEESVTARARVEYLHAWAEQKEAMRPGRVGAKHPLLSLCANDLALAWGEDTRFVWARRPIEDSIAGLVRRGWFRGHEARLQRRLWDAIDAFETSGAKVERIEWTDLHEDPMATARRLATIVGITDAETRLAAATRFVRRA